MVIRRSSAPILLALACTLVSTGAASSQEPSSEALWRQRPPPFKVYVEGLAAPSQWGAAMETRYGVLPWMTPPLDPKAERLLALEQAASHASDRFASVGLRAPRITRRDGVYPVYLVRDLGGAAAQYGPGYGTIGTSQALRFADNDWDRVVIVGEADGFGKDMAIYPEKVAASQAHEIFHAIQASYAHWSGHDKSHAHEEKWVTEALPDAISEWAIEGLSFLGNPPFQARTRFASGSPRFGKALGMRPYDYPLDLRTEPPRMPIFPAGTSGDSRREMASYMTNSFWSYAWRHSMPTGKAWSPMSRALLLRTPGGRTASVREDAVVWSDQSLARYHPAWTRGLYDALPAFIPWWVAFPDDVMGSRRGEFAHARWLRHAFIDGCPLYELNDAQPSASFKVAIRELAANCVRVKWTGASVGKSGWPAAALVILSADGGGETALTDMHVGMHGTNLGKSEPFNDPATGLPSLTWGGLSLDPRHPGKTDGETVITFTNVARDPLATIRRTYDVHLGMGAATASGQLHKPAQPGHRPASQVRVAPRRHVVPGLVLPVPSGKGLTMALTPAPMAGKDDCANATAKAAGLVALGMGKMQAMTGAPNLMSICMDVAAKATRASLNPALQPEIELKLPAIPDGHLGPIAGGRMIVTWNDPGLGEPGKQHVDARTENVDLDISQANAAFVRGRFAARFEARENTADGEISGDFLVWRAPTDQRLALADPIDHASSDMLQTLAGMGKSPEEMRAQLGRGKPKPRATTPAPASSGALDCPMDCESVKTGKVSAQCRELMHAFYDACPDGASASREDVVALATWMYREMPEPMRTEMLEGTVDTVMTMPSALRETWVSKLRAERQKAGN